MAHEHAPYQTEKTLTAPYHGCVNPTAEGCTPTAHGGKLWRVYCACGASRASLCNGHHVENGPWEYGTEIDYKTVRFE